MRITGCDELEELFHYLQSFKIWMACQADGCLFSCNIDIFLELLFGFMAGDLHDINGRNACKVHVGRA